MFCLIDINILKGTSDIPGSYQQMATPPAGGSGEASSAALRMR